MKRLLLILSTGLAASHLASAQVDIANRVDNPLLGDSTVLDTPGGVLQTATDGQFGGAAPIASASEHDTSDATTEVAAQLYLASPLSAGRSRVPYLITLSAMSSRLRRS